MPTTTVTVPADLAPTELFAVLPWPDPGADEGHDPRGVYVETFWLGTLGPSTTLLHRHLANGFDRWPHGYELDLRATATALGLTVLGANGPFAKALQRLVQFGLAQPHGHGLVVRRTVPSLSAKHVARLPEHLRAAHHAWTAMERDPTVLDRAHCLAVPLLGTGATRGAVVRDLQLLGIPPRIAHQAAEQARPAA